MAMVSMISTLHRPILIYKCISESLYHDMMLKRYTDIDTLTHMYMLHMYICMNVYGYMYISVPKQMKRT